MSVYDVSLNLNDRIGAVNKRTRNQQLLFNRETTTITWNSLGG